jgi:hypothetical protein
MVLPEKSRPTSGAACKRSYERIGQGDRAQEIRACYGLRLGIDDALEMSVHQTAHGAEDRFEILLLAGANPTVMT